MDVLEEAMNTIKHKGFINYYGMQRFGTASVPTHSIGLTLLRSEWQKAVDLILSKRHGEHPDVVVAREAWLDRGDLERALELMPRRVVAERCILESYKKQKGETRNAMGALSTVTIKLFSLFVRYLWELLRFPRPFASCTFTHINLMCGTRSFLRGFVCMVLIGLLLETWSWSLVLTTASILIKWKETNRRKVYDALI